MNGNRGLPVVMPLVCVALLGIASRLVGQDEAGGPSPVDELAIQQGIVADKYAKLEKLLEDMARIEAVSNPRRGALLMQALKLSKENLTLVKLNAIVRQLNQEQLTRAVESQAEAEKEMRTLLELLLSENRSDRLQSEQQRIRQYIKEVERIIRLQKGVQGRTEGGSPAGEMAQDQGRIADRTDQLAERMKQDGQGDANAAQGSQGANQRGADAKAGGQGEGEPKDENKGQEPESGQDTEPHRGEGQKPGQAKPGSGGQSKQSPQGQGQNAPGGQGDSGEPGQGQGGKQSPSKGQSQSQGQGQSQSPNGDQGGEGGQDGQQSKQEDQSARKRIQAAEQRMRQAKQRLEEAKRKEAVAEQEKAREELEKAKAELERILRQLREEEVERMLALLEGRFRKMLEMQIRIYEDTIRLDKVPEPERAQKIPIPAGKLASSERKLVLDADKALNLLIEEGSSIAFPETVEQMRDDMQQVADRLDEARVGGITQGIEEDIIAALEEMIEALQKAQQDLDQQKNRQKPMPMRPQDMPLVDGLAELKMIRSLQMRVNTRTQRYARLLDDPDDPAGQAIDHDLVEALGKLAERQERIYQITRDLVLGKNR